LSGSDEPVLTNIGIKPDNLSWSKTGTLIVAGQIQSASKIFKCVASNVDVCSIPFKIIEVDPKTLKTIRVLVDEAAARAYSGATSGLQVGNEIWVSSFRNNKIARYRKN
jgi:CRISPR/Cas system-associated protein Csm6